MGEEPGNEARCMYDDIVTKYSTLDTHDFAKCRTKMHDDIFFIALPPPN